jgi:hypothetical protein
VNDVAAQVFGEALYEHLLVRRRSFGDAVFEARKALWKDYSGDATWGAFQAYGDPGWLAEPRADDGPIGGGDGHYASPDELLDDLARIRDDFSRKRDRQGEGDLRGQMARVEHILEKRCPPAWLEMPEVQSALGAAWYDLGRFEKARKAYLLAIQAEDKNGRVPIKDIEQLANVEARLGEKLEAKPRAAPAGAAPAKASKAVRAESPDKLIDLAISRLEMLDRLVSAEAQKAPGAPARTGVNAERAALRGSALKRKASLFARRLLARKRAAASDPKRKKMLEKMREALEASAEAYRLAEASPGDHRFRPYHALNRLALMALLPWKTPADRDAAIALAQQCRQAAAQSYARRPNVWDAAMQAEAVLVERLLDEKLGLTGDAGQAAFDEVVRAYEDAMSNVTIKPSELDSVLSQMELFSTFCSALALDDTAAAAFGRLAGRLRDLVQRLQPGRTPLEAQPSGPKPSPRKSRSGAAATEATAPAPKKIPTPRRARRKP